MNEHTPFSAQQLHPSHWISVHGMTDFLRQCGWMKVLVKSTEAGKPEMPPRSELSVVCSGTCLLSKWRDGVRREGYQEVVGTNDCPQETELQMSQSPTRILISEHEVLPQTLPFGLSGGLMVSGCQILLVGNSSPLLRNSSPLLRKSDSPTRCVFLENSSPYSSHSASHLCDVVTSHLPIIASLVLPWPVTWSVGPGNVALSRRPSPLSQTTWDMKGRQNKTTDFLNTLHVQPQRLVVFLLMWNVQDQEYCGQLEELNTITRRPSPQLPPIYTMHPSLLSLLTFLLICLF